MLKDKEIKKWMLTLEINFFRKNYDKGPRANEVAILPSRKVNTDRDEIYSLINSQRFKTMIQEKYDADINFIQLFSLAENMAENFTNFIDQKEIEDIQIPSLLENIIQQTKEFKEYELM